MIDNEKLLAENKDFIKGVALYGNAPQRGNDIVVSILAAFDKIDSTVEVLSECATCDNIYRDSFRIIHAYCESKNWFEKEVKSKK